MLQLSWRFYCENIQLWHQGSTSAIVEPKQEEASFSPLIITSNSWQTNGIIVETLFCKRTTLMKKKSNRNWGTTRENGQAFTQWKTLWSCIEIWSPVNVCFPFFCDALSVFSYPTVKVDIKLDQVPQVKFLQLEKQFDSVRINFIVNV